MMVGWVLYNGFSMKVRTLDIICNPIYKFNKAYMYFIFFKLFYIVF